MNSQESNQICETNIIKTIVTAVGEIIARIVRFLDSIFRPSWAIDAVGCVPVVGNITNLGCAIRAYVNGQTSLGHKKLLDTVVGTGTDIITFSHGAVVGALDNLKKALKSSNVGSILKGIILIFIELLEYAITRIHRLMGESECLSSLQKLLPFTDLLKRFLM